MNLNISLLKQLIREMYKEKTPARVVHTVKHKDSKEEWYNDEHETLADKKYADSKESESTEIIPEEDEMLDTSDLVTVGDETNLKLDDLLSKLEDIDTSIDYLTATVSGEDPSEIARLQKAYGRAHMPGRKASPITTTPMTSVKVDEHKEPIAMKITKLELKKIIAEESAKLQQEKVSAVNELEKQGFFKRMAGKVGLGSVKGAGTEINRIRKKFTQWRSELSRAAGVDDSWDQHGNSLQDDQGLIALDSAFREKEHSYNALREIVMKLIDKASDPQFLPDKSQRSSLVVKLKDIRTAMNAIASIGDSAARATQKLEQEEAARLQAAEVRMKEKAAADAEAARANQPRISKAAQFDPDAKRQRDDKAEEDWRNDPKGMKGAFEESKKLNLSHLQQIIKEEVAKLNEKK